MIHASSDLITRHQIYTIVSLRHAGSPITILYDPTTTNWKTVEKAAMLYILKVEDQKARERLKSKDEITLTPDEAADLIK